MPPFWLNSVPAILRKTTTARTARPRPPVPASDEWQLAEPIMIFFNSLTSTLEHILQKDLAYTNESMNVTASQIRGGFFAPNHGILFSSAKSKGFILSALMSNVHVRTVNLTNSMRSIFFPTFLHAFRVSHECFACLRYRIMPHDVAVIQ